MGSSRAGEQNKPYTISQWNKLMKDLERNRASGSKQDKSKTNDDMKAKQLSYERVSKYC